MKLLSELKRRNVHRMAVLYAVVAWLIMQLAEVMLSLVELPAVTGEFVLILLAIGFPIALVFSWFFELTPEGLSLEKNVRSGESRADITGRRADFIIIALLCAAVIVFAYDKWWASSPPPQSIAVLPFVDMSPEGDQEYFADGLAEELISRLTEIDSLLVSGRASSFHFKDRDEDLKTIGEQLSVSHVLEGSVRKAGDELRITARLTDVSSGFQLWSDTYERGLEDIFAIQKEIAEAAATALSVRLSVGAPGAIEGGTDNIKAYEAFLAGNAAYQREELLRAIDHYEQATNLDPSFALAWERQANAYQQAFWDFGELGADRWLQRRDEAIARAVSAAPDSRQVLNSLAVIEVYRRNLVEARRLFDEIHSRDEAGVARYSVEYVDLLTKTGNTRQALWVAHQIERRDPLNPMLPNYLTQLYLSLGRLEDALETVERGYASAIPKRYLAISGVVVALTMDQPDEILKWLAEWHKWYPPVGPLKFPPPDWDRLFDDDHRPDWLYAAFEASRALDYHIVNWAAYYGEDELALKAMRRSLDPWAFWTPLTARLRTTDEFKQIVRQAGLVDYWKEYGWNDFCAPTDSEDFECH